jgi:nicotinate-nucleotide adenylyltransferase
VLGGTFDPPHNGHLVIAQEALVHLSLSEVIFAPSRQPPHKLGHPITPITQRMEMVRLAIASNPRFTLSRVDVDRAGPTFTVDTIRMLRRQLGDAAKLYFIMGMDSLISLPSWHQPEELIKLCWLAVFERPGFSADLSRLEQSLPGLADHLVFIPAPALDIAASDLQRRIRAGESISPLVPEAVAAYIRSHSLYRQAP